MRTIEVFADVTCPFTHVGLRRMVAARQAKGRDDVVLVDIRDPRELQREGKVPGAFHCPRGMLEFWVDPQSPYYKPALDDGRRRQPMPIGCLRPTPASVPWIRPIDRTSSCPWSSDRSW